MQYLSMLLVSPRASGIFLCLHLSMVQMQDFAVPLPTATATGTIYQLLFLELQVVPPAYTSVQHPIPLE